MNTIEDLLFWGMTNTYYSGAWPIPIVLGHDHGPLKGYTGYISISCNFSPWHAQALTQTHTQTTQTHTHTSMHKYIYDVNIDWYINRMARGGKVDRIWSVPCEGFCLRFLKYAQKWTKHMRNEKQWEGIGFPILSPWQAHRPQIPPRFCPIDPIVLESLALASQCTDKSTWLSKERDATTNHVEMSSTQERTPTRMLIMKAWDTQHRKPKPANRGYSIFICLYVIPRHKAAPCAM